jgi:hypothetical protein
MILLAGIYHPEGYNRNLQHHGLVCLLKVRNMRTALAGASPTLPAAGQSCCKKNCQYGKKHVFLHVFALLFQALTALIALQGQNRIVFCATAYRILHARAMLDICEAVLKFGSPRSTLWTSRSGCLL